MGRLDDIAARNLRENRRGRRRMVIALGVSTIVIVLIVLTLYTDLATPPRPVQDHAFHIELRQVPSKRHAP